MEPNTKAFDLEPAPLSHVYGHHLPLYQPNSDMKEMKDIVCDWESDKQSGFSVRSSDSIEYVTGDVKKEDREVEESEGGRGNIGSTQSWKPYEHLLHPFDVWWKIRNTILRPFQWRFYIPFPSVNEMGWSLGEIILGFVLIIVLVAMTGGFLNHYFTEYSLSDIFNGRMNNEKSVDSRAIRKSQWREYIESTGTLSLVFLIFTYTCATRLSFFTFLFGIPHERQLTPHKFLAILGGIASLIHGGVYHLSPLEDLEWEMWTGWIAVAFILFLYLSSFYIIRRNYYQIFYYSHLLGFIGLGVVGGLHGAAVYSGIIIWGVDVFGRYLITYIMLLSSKKATISHSECQIISLTLPHHKSSFLSHYLPGQYYYLCIPSLTAFEWHPFSASSSPHHSSLTFHIRVNGDWTERLAHTIQNGKQQNEITLLLDGPYGSPMIDIDGNHYDSFLFIGGGVGITPLLSMRNSLINQSHRGRPVRIIHLIWVIRDLLTFYSFYPHSIEEYMVDGNAICHPTNDTSLHDESNAVGQNGIWSPYVPLPYTANLNDNGGDTEGTRLHHENNQFHAHITQDSSPLPSLPQNSPIMMHTGRPDISLIFQEIKQRALAMGQNKVAVLCCGPSSLTDCVREWYDLSLWR
jgi:hypothetical protein